MLEHQMLIIEKVSSNRDLFIKELEKSFRWLNLQEIEKLHSWVTDNYSDKYSKTIEEIF